MKFLEISFTPIPQNFPTIAVSPFPSKSTTRPRVSPLVSKRKMASIDRVRRFHFIVFLFLFSLLKIQGERNDGRILFFDNPEQRYLRSSSNDDHSASSMSSSEIAATVSVLLGFAPPPSLEGVSYAKLDKILQPNPFNRPHAVMVLEVSGLEDSLMVLNQEEVQLDGAGAYSSRVLVHSGTSELEVSDDDDLALLRLDEPLGNECSGPCIEQELHYLAHVLGGSYVGGDEPVEGTLAFTLASGGSLKLHVSREADREFAMGIVSFVRNIKWAIEMRGDFVTSVLSRAELLTGHFTGIEALQDKYGADVANQGMELFLAVSRKFLDLLGTHYNGHVVGVLIARRKSSPVSRKVLAVTYSARFSRWLEEVGSSNSTDIGEVQLVRTTLAWVTGIVLLVAALIGTYYLLYMPLTKDTLLYSNVKLD